MIYNILKRTLDILAAITLILLFLPVWVLVPLLIRLDSKGSSFYSQERLGKDGKTFRIYKFRTMKPDADDYWKKNPELYKKFKKQSWKLSLEEDPRITRIGRVIRQTSIDEFPQVFNILRGEMSLVGPRPIRGVEKRDAIKRYGKEIQDYLEQSLTVKPGLTGPWQVSGRNDVPWDKRVQIDAKYANRKNIFDDIKIILQTPLAMISKW